MKFCSASECDRPARERGWCKKHHYRWKRYGDPLVTAVTPPGEKLRTLHAAIATETDDCLIWPFPLNRGYAKLSINNRTVCAYVVVCESAHGPRPSGMEVAHSCGVAACVNPRHLRWATHADNNRDRWRHGTMPRGESHYAAKLTAGDVAEIRRRSGERIAVLAHEFGVARATVRRVLDGTTWRHV